MEKDKTVYCDGTRHLTRSELQNLVERSETRNNVLNVALHLAEDNLYSRTDAVNELLHIAGELVD